MAEAQFYPLSPPIRNEARLVAAKYLGSGNTIGELNDRVLKEGEPIVKEATQTGCRGANFGVWTNRWRFSGSSRNWGTSSDFRFTMHVSGSRHGPCNLQAPSFSPRIAAAFTFDVTCPSGHDQFQWLLQGIAQDNKGNGRRYVHAYVGRRNGNWQSHLDDARTYDSSNSVGLLPNEWSAEHQGVSYPVAPGETVRFFFEFQAFDVATSSPNQWDLMSDVTMWMAFLDSRKEASMLRDTSGKQTVVYASDDNSNNAHEQ